MQLSNIPGKLVLPFANAGGKSTIPVASQIGITAGAASLMDGFPPLTRTPIAAGGVPPSGLDMNGILYEMSAIIRWANAGGGYPFDGTFATDTNVGGYPKGARVMRSDGTGYWFNTVENNVTDPEGAGAAAAGWVPDFTTGVAAVTMTGSSVTLTPAQYGKPVIVVTGTLTANLNLIFPNIAGQWTVINNATGGYGITAKTASGNGVTLGTISQIVGDGTNIYSANPDSVQIVNNVATLRNITPNLSRRIQTEGYYVDGDGGSGQYLPKVGAAPGTYVDNGGTVIVPTGGNGSSAWLLDVICGTVSVTQFGAKGDNTTDDTVSLNAAVAAGVQRVIVTYGAVGVYKVTGAVTIAAPITLEFLNSNICFKKYYGDPAAGRGNAIVITSGLVELINPGIDGNGATYGGSGILFGPGTTYSCKIENPRIFNTKDSCIVFEGDKSGSGVVISGGSLSTYNASGVSANGYPAIRKIGAADTDASPRIITDVGSSYTPLIDVTGMITTFVKGGQCATILFGGNPDVTGATYVSAKTSVVGVRVRDGMWIRGEDHTFSANISHGYAPQYSSYGVLTTPLTVGWKFNTDARNCNADSSNLVINKITDAATGLGGNCNKFFTVDAVFTPLWLGSVTNPAIGNGTISGVYNVTGAIVDVAIFITMGSTTTFGSGSYTISLPLQISAATYRGIGQARVFNSGVNGAEWGMVLENTRGSTSKVSIAATTGADFSPTVPHTLKAGDYIEINYRYLRG